MSIKIERDYSLARLTTVRAGGNAELFARPASEAELIEVLGMAAAGGHPVEVVGSGSNLLVADTGVQGMVLKLDGELTELERNGTRVRCGGGVRLPSAAAKIARWGLTGLEFGINIPGTVGGAVRMNANAYGGQLAEVLEEVTVCTANGKVPRRPTDLGFGYRHSNLSPGEVVAGAWFQLADADPDQVKATLAAMRAKRHEAQPSGIKTFGSTFKNPEDERAAGMSAGQLLDAVGARGLRVGEARLSEKHANFVENMGAATTSEILELMSRARHLVYEHHGLVLEPEVQILGDPEWPADWAL